MSARCPASLAPWILTALALTLLAPPAVADETQPAGIPPPLLAAGRTDLLPFDDFERAAFQREHGPLIYRIQALSREAAATTKQLADRKDKQDPQARALQKARRRLEVQIVALRTRLSQELVAHGVDGSLIAWMNRAPSGPGRVERYAYGLVLLGDLTPVQRALFERVVRLMEGAHLSLAAQKERTELALKQTALEKSAISQLLRTFDRQVSVIDKRFWQLVDFTLAPEQRAWIWRRLPTRLKRKSQPVEHFYALPGLTPLQGAKLKALFTEVEQEASPDDAAVKRVANALRDRKLDRAARTALEQERRQAYGRLGALRGYAAETTRAILTDAQWLAYEAIPPRLSTNDRRAGYRILLEGFVPARAQATRIQALERAARVEGSEIRRRTQALRRAGSDLSPDSPQRMGMQMQMMSAAAEGEANQRTVMGRIFLEVLTPEQVGRWAMGHYGYKR